MRLLALISHGQIRRHRRYDGGNEREYFLYLKPMNTSRDRALRETFQHKANYCYNTGAIKIHLNTKVVLTTQELNTEVEF